MEKLQPIAPRGIRKGKMITAVEEVIQLAKARRAVVYRGSRVPAAFIQNFQARHLFREIELGVLHEYRLKGAP